MSENASTTDKIAAYTEVCRSYHAVDDFRAKLLALLPIVSGGGGIFLLTNETVLKGHLLPIGLFGVLVTLGLLCFEARGLSNCGHLIEVGKKLEESLELDKGQRQFFALETKKWFGLSRASIAAYTVYLSVLIGWSYVAWVGFSALGSAAA